MKSNYHNAAMGALAALAMVATAGAASIVVPNSSFESPSTGTFTTTAPTSWLASGGFEGFYGVQVIVDNITGVTGSQTAYLNQQSQMWSAADLTTITLGETYTLMVDTWARPVWPSLGFTVELGNSDFSQILATTGTVTVSGLAPTTFTLIYTPVALDPAIGSGLRVRVSNIASQQVLFDNVRLDAIPEPSVALLGGLGMLGLLRRRRA